MRVLHRKTTVLSAFPQTTTNYTTLCPAELFRQYIYTPNGISNFIETQDSLW